MSRVYYNRSFPSLLALKTMTCVMALLVLTQSHFSSKLTEIQSQAYRISGSL
jgi:hypothetical protein